MSRTPDSSELAARFLRLWEESWQQIAQDPQVASLWTDLFATLQRSVAVGDVATTGATPYSYEHVQRGRQTNRSAPAAASPVDGGDRIGELERRVAELERAVAALGRSGQRKRRPRA